MLLATRCPFCETLFRIQPGQLAVRGGFVRCGRCHNTFDASGNLFEFAIDANLARVTPVASGLAQSLIQHDAPPLLADHNPAGQTPPATGEAAPPVPVAPAALPAGTPAAPDTSAASPDTPTASGIPDTTDTPPATPAAADTPATNTAPITPTTTPITPVTPLPSGGNFAGNVWDPWSPFPEIHFPAPIQFNAEHLPRPSLVPGIVPIITPRKIRNPAYDPARASKALPEPTPHETLPTVTAALTEHTGQLTSSVSGGPAQPVLVPPEETPGEPSAQTQAAAPGTGIEPAATVSGDRPGQPPVPISQKEKPDEPSAQAQATEAEADAASGQAGQTVATPGSGPAQPVLAPQEESHNAPSVQAQTAEVGVGADAASGQAGQPLTTPGSDLVQQPVHAPQEESHNAPSAQVQTVEAGAEADAASGQAGQTVTAPGSGLVQPPVLAPQEESHNAPSAQTQTAETGVGAGAASGQAGQTVAAPGSGLIQQPVLVSPQEEKLDAPFAQTKTATAEPGSPTATAPGNGLPHSAPTPQKETRTEARKESQQENPDEAAQAQPAAPAFRRVERIASGSNPRPSAPGAQKGKPGEEPSSRVQTAASGQREPATTAPSDRSDRSGSLVPAPGAEGAKLDWRAARPRTPTTSAPSSADIKALPPLFPPPPPLPALPPHMPRPASSSPLLLDALSEEDGTLHFSVTQEEEAAQRTKSRAWRVALPLLALVLCVLLGAQLAWWLREKIMVHWASTQPLYHAVCDTLGCHVPPPRNIDGLKVEPSNMRQAADGDAHRLELTVPLRNRLNVALAWPAIELTLLDAQNSIVARRVLYPRDYIDSTGRIAAGLPARSTQTMYMQLDTGNITASNFRVEIFYPQASRGARSTHAQAGH